MVNDLRPQRTDIMDDDLLDDDDMDMDDVPNINVPVRQPPVKGSKAARQERSFGGR